MVSRETRNIIKVMGLAVALPSTILGVFFTIYYLIENKLISTSVGLVLLLAVIIYFFYLMVRYASSKK